MKLIIHLLCALIFIGCSKPNNELNLAFKLAGKNRNQLEKVLKHYSCPQDSMKYKAAVFIMVNLTDSYTNSGKVYNGYRNVYSTLSKVNKSQRNEILRIGLDSLGLNSKVETKPTLRVISADYLIKHIDFAFHAWENSRWSTKINFCDFCEYILPFKYDKEGISEYAETFHKTYAPFLKYLFFEGGNRYYAKDQKNSTTPT